MGQSIHHGDPELRRAQRLTGVDSGDRVPFPRVPQGDPEHSMEDEACFSAWIVQYTSILALYFIHFFSVIQVIQNVDRSIVR